MEQLHASKIRNLETVYGVRVSREARSSASEITSEYKYDEPSLKDVDSIKLLERACKILKTNLDRDKDENLMDWDDYYHDRAYVEVMELRKEKSVACRTDVLPRVEKEFANSTSKLESFKNKWSAVLANQRHELAKRPNLITCLYNQILQFMDILTSNEHGDAKNPIQLLQKLNSVMFELEQSVHSAFMERLVVRSSEVVKAASELTGLPEKAFHNPFILRRLLPIGGLTSRLSEKLIGLDEVILKIEHGLLKQKSVNGPLGSFLLLGPHGCGRSTLAASLAEEIYGDRKRFLELNMSEFDDPNNVGRIVQYLSREKKAGYVVMFEDLKIVHRRSYQLISRIVMNGSITHGPDSLDFFNDIVLVSTRVGHDLFTDCECLHSGMSIRLREILTKPALFHDTGTNNCHLHQFYTKVVNEYGFEFLDIFTDTIVLPRLTLQNHMAISRLQLRELANGMSFSLQRSVILYPSHAAVSNMMTCCREEILQRGARAYQDWQKEHLPPRLSGLKNEAEEMLIVYVDMLVGLKNELVVRVENGTHFEKDKARSRFRKSISSLRSIYQHEKLDAYYIQRIRLKLSCLRELLSTKSGENMARAIKECESAVTLIDDLSEHNNLEEMDELGDDSESSSSERETKRTRICLDEVTTKLESLITRQDKAAQVITEALLRQTKEESSYLPESFLCLGLTLESNEQLEQNLGELLLKVDLSICKAPDSFFSSAYIENTNLLLVEVVSRNPHSVVVFHNLEIAHVSVYSAIISILDYGRVKDDLENVTSFESCVVVIISNHGNKEIMSKLNREYPKTINIDLNECVGTSTTPNRMETGALGLRFEVLNRLDHMLIFDPFSDDQLNQFVMLAMKPLVEKEHCLYKAFSDLINMKKQGEEETEEEIMKHIEGALGQGILKIR